MTELLKYHGLALLAGYILDLIIGDPHSMPHPIRLIGKLISFIEKKIYKDKVLAGLALVILVELSVTIVISTLMIVCYKISPVSGIIAEAVLSFYCLATKSLKVESDAVIKSLREGGLTEAKRSLSMIVGRDTDSLTKEQIIRATVETVAENTSDGVIAPLLYLAIGGPVLGFFYKACNTMDSMVGYRNQRYKNFGLVAAKFDDVANYIPSRICAALIILSAFLLNGFDGRESFRIWKRDRRNHKSPNSAQSEAAFAGAMGLRLAGGAYYFGEWVEKPFIGDEINLISENDVDRSHRLLYMTSFLCEVICTVAIFILTI